MTKVKLTSQAPGIIGLLESFPESAKPLSELAQHLLRSDKYAMPTWMRENIAGFVSQVNKVAFCELSHTYASSALLKKHNLTDEQVDELVDAPKLQVLLNLAGAVNKLDRVFIASATKDALEESGVSEEDIHLTVLIASAFAMYNRYVDGMQTEYSKIDADYYETGDRLAEYGYIKAEAVAE